MSLDIRAFRDSLGRFATGISVVTACSDGREPEGMTVNSFSSLSLEPPLILWSIQRDSDCLPAFAAASGFAVNILRDHQEDVSRHYAQKGDHRLLTGTSHLGRSGQAVLDDCLTSFECEVWRRYDGGDHIIIIGQVLEMESHPDAQPLVYYGGGYRHLR